MLSCNSHVTRCQKTATLLETVRSSVVGVAYK